MTRRLSTSVIVGLLVSLLAASPVLADKTYRAERFDVQIELQGDGGAIITEIVEFQFEGGDFTYVSRGIAATETDGITFLEASMDSISMPPGTQAGQAEVGAGDPLMVTWHFAPTSDAAHVFVLRYRAAGMIRKGEADTLIWRAVPEEHDYPIARSSVTLIHPPGAVLLEAPSLSRSFEASSTDRGETLSAGALARNEDLILTARFAPGSVTQATPIWQTRKQQVDEAARSALPVGFLAGIATLVLGILGLYALSRSNERDLNLSPVVSTPNPPADIPPAVVGKLTGQQHNSMGAVFDLAQRGVLEVHEERGFLGTKKYVLSRKETGLPLQPQEQGLLDALFKPNETQINLGEIGTRLESKKRLFEEPLEQQLIQRGWLDGERKQKRSALSTASIVTMTLSLLMLCGLIGVGAALRDPGSAVLIGGLAGVGAGAFLFSIMLLVYAATFSPLTPLGEDQKARWQGFAEYLKGVSKGEEPAVRTDYFERYLAYAAVFGLGAKWSKYFQRLGGVPLPAWFHAMAGSDGDFGAIVAVMSASDSAGASVGGAGAGGASGGGSSGAG